MSKLSFASQTFFDKDGERISTTQYGAMPERKKVTLKKLLRLHIENILKERKDLQLVQIARKLDGSSEPPFSILAYL